MAHDVFISYSAIDKPVADAVAAGLERRHLRCWIAPRDIRAGREYGEEIIEGIGQCQVMVLIFSKSSNQSKQVVREVERAVHGSKVILPFRIEDTSPSGSMEYFLSLPHWLDALTPPLEGHIDQLAVTVRSILAGEASVPGKALPAISGAPATPPLRRAPVALVAAVLGLLVVLAGAVVFLTGHQQSTSALPPSTVPKASPPPSAPADGIKSAADQATGQAARDFVRHGIDLYERGDFDGALDQHEQAILADPGFADAYFHRGNAWKAKNEPDRAIRDYTKALELRPGFADVFYNRGNAWLDKGDRGQAIADYTRALELDPRNWLALNNRGWARKLVGDLDLALADFDAVLALKPGDDMATKNRAATLEARAAAGKPQPPPASEILFENGNIYAAENGPTRPTIFTLNTPCVVSEVTNYHWNGGRGAAPGTIALRQQGGRLFGPWKATGRAGQGGVPNAYWIARPAATLPPGTYTVVDSSPETWSQNSASQGSGFSRVDGYPVP